MCICGFVGRVCESPGDIPLCVCSVRLTEVYYECKVSKLEAFVTAVGISSGNALSVKLLFVVLLTALLAGRKTGTRKTGSYRTYGVEEREEVSALHCRAQQQC